MPFSKETLDFLMENRLRNSRDWFAEHRAAYDRFVFEPLRELVVALGPCVLTIDPALTAEPRVDKTICRIRRDTRYSRDKSLYRENMWVIFRRGKMHSVEVPGLYFEIAPDGFHYGCGFYDAPAGYMETLRRMVLSGAPAFRAAQKALREQDLFVMEGECYKRPRYPGASEEARQWLERRNISFSADSGDWALCFSDELKTRLAADFTRLAPVYRFLLEAALTWKGQETARELEAAGR